MARDSAYICSSCGASYAKWSGQCGACGEWNSLDDAAQFASGPSKSALNRSKRAMAAQLSTLSTDIAPPERMQTGNSELDRALGGGLVPAASILLGGDPGIGKSTLLLQAAAHFGKTGKKVLYISGEEAADQIRLRAIRLGLGDSTISLLTETNLSIIIATLDAEKPDLVIIDSIQTMWIDAIDSAPGTVSQVRGAAHELTQYANRKGPVIILVGHVTKEGQIAGPRIVEHMVDTVLYFEGEKGHHFRILRTIKNRFGAANEIGVFEMTHKGLEEVENPSALFLGARENPQPGSVVFAGIEGSRPVLFEIQALVIPSSLSQPRRSVIGWDSGRLAMILAVLEARCGVAFSGCDIYLNVAGGLKIYEPAADLAAAAALVSAKVGKVLPADAVFFGELSLSASLRPAAQSKNRLKEAQKLGFTHASIPTSAKIEKMTGMTIDSHNTLGSLLDHHFPQLMKTQSLAQG